MLVYGYAFNNFFHWTRLEVSETGLAALVRLSNGDMRKALNILQVINFFPSNFAAAAAIIFLFLVFFL